MLTGFSAGAVRLEKATRSLPLMVDRNDVVILVITTRQIDSCFLYNNRNYEYLVYGITNTRATAQFLTEILRLYCTRDHSSIYCLWFVGLCTTCQSQNRQVSNIVNVFGLPDANGTGYRESVSANHYYLLLLKIYFLKLLVPPYNLALQVRQVAWLHF